MIVTSVHAAVVDLPLREHQIMGAGELAGRVDNVFVRVRADDGRCGYGEAATWGLFTAETPTGIRDLVNEVFAPLLVGARVADVAAGVDRIDAAILGNPGAKSAVEMALYDLAARRLDIPVEELFGGAVRDSLALSYSVSAQDPGVERDLVARRYADGYRIFKIKSGVRGWRTDLERLRWICDLADDVVVRMDFNGSATPDGLAALLPGIAELPIESIEQPFPPHDTDRLRWLRTHCRIPLTVDEGCRARGDVRQVLESGLYDSISLKVGKFGGLAATHAVAKAASFWGVSGYAGAFSESRLAVSAALRLMLTLTDLREGSDYYFPLVVLDDGELDGGFIEQDGRLRPTDAAGFGVELPDRWFR